MKGTRIVRRIGDIGSFVIPLGLRKSLNMNTDDPLDIYLEDKAPLE